MDIINKLINFHKAYILRQLTLPCLKTCVFGQIWHVLIIILLRY